jgi:hypothetical protein
MGRDSCNCQKTKLCKVPRQVKGNSLNERTVTLQSAHAFHEGLEICIDLRRKMVISELHNLRNGHASRRAGESEVGRRGLDTCVKPVDLVALFGNCARQIRRFSGKRPKSREIGEARRKARIFNRIVLSGAA